MKIVLEELKNQINTFEPMFVHERSVLFNTVNCTKLSNWAQHTVVYYECNSALFKNNVTHLRQLNFCLHGINIRIGTLCVSENEIFLQ